MLRRLLSLGFIVLLLLFPFMIFPIHATSPWWIQLVDSTDNVGYYSSIALDSNGNPHIAYSDMSNWNLKYASWSGSEWTIQVVDSLERVNTFASMAPSLAIDSSDNPHISYVDDENANLKYASWTGSAWSIQTVDSQGNVGGYISLKLDSFDKPHICYQKMAPDFDLKYARWTGSQWETQTVDSAGNVGYFCSLSLDFNGNPRVSYCDTSNINSSIAILKFAAWTGSSWNIQVVDSAGDVGRFDSLALDSRGNAHISYYDGMNGHLKYASQIGSAWNIQVVDFEGDTGDVGLSTSLALDSEDLPHISYIDRRDSDLKYAWHNGSSWSVQIVNSDDESCLSPSLALSPEAYPRISYFSTVSMDLKYAAVNATSFPTPLMPPSLSPSPTPVSQINGIQVVESAAADVGMYSSLALDSNNNPHIAYFNLFRPENTSVKYAKWTGSNWSIQTVDGNGITGVFPSLALDSKDNPYIVYRDMPMLKYASWTGSKWVFQSIGSPGEYGSDNSLALDADDNPRLSYRETMNSELRYASFDNSRWTLDIVDAEGTACGSYNSLALDSSSNPHICYMQSIPAGGLKYAHYDGLAWHVETVDSGGAGVGFDTSIAVDSTGKVHISYFSFITGTFNCYLKYAVSSDSGWKITTVDAGNGVGQDTSLALDSQDNPHISYYDGGNGDLRYAWWNGSAWNIRVIDSVGDVGSGTSLALDTNDEAHISYYDHTNTDLKYVHIADPNIFPAANSPNTPNPSPNPSPQPTPSPSPIISGPVLGDIRIMPDGTVQGTDKIQRNGNVYTLTDDITVELNNTFGDLKPCLIIMRDFAVVDGAGHTIKSNGTGLGIYARGVQGVTIQNFKIRGFTEGISSYVMDPVAPIEILYKKTANNKILNNDIEVVNCQNSLFSDISGWGIYVEFSEDTFVKGNIIKTQDPSKGLYVGATCNKTTITSNRFVECGMDLYTLRQKIIDGNTIDGKPIIFLDGKSNQIVEGAEQVFVYNCNNISVSNVNPNNCCRRTIQLEQTSNSAVTKCQGIIALTNCSNNSVYENSPTNIALFKSSNNKVFQNIVTGGEVIFPRTTSEKYDGRRCIDLSGSNYNDIYENTLKDSNCGIRLGEIEGGSQHNNIYLNNIFNVGQGILLAYSSENAIHSNRITDCSVGLSISVSNDIRAYQNNVTRCGTAVSICGSNNIFYHNNFIENTQQVSVRHQMLFTSDIIIAYSTNNTFDAGYPSGGNYWSDYNGSDTDNDSMGDTSYTVFENVVDHYPLMKPFITESATASKAGSQQNSASSVESETTTSSDRQSEASPAGENSTSTLDGDLIEPSESSLSAISIVIGALLYTIVFGPFAVCLYLIKHKH
jgi:putative cofactor-binding repeat protein/parallel beta-helix repeat protein